MYFRFDITYLTELAHLLGKIHSAVKNDIQNIVNHIQEEATKRRDPRLFDFYT
jgi:hypothetical protein